MKRVALSVCTVSLAVMLIAGCRPAGTGSSGSGVAIDPAQRTVDFDATVHAGSWDEGEMAGYHLLVWKGGDSADASLFQASVSDVEVLDALESLGAVPGNALDLATWDERDDPSSWKPDQMVQGPPVEVLVRTKREGDWLRLDQVVHDPMGVGFDLRLGGHRANIPACKSGCVISLSSCPGGKIGNARYTVRDFTKGTTRFAVKPDVLPDDGERVTIRIRLLDAA